MTNGTVLLVDHHPETIQTAKLMLTRASYGVLTASAADEALEILHRQEPIDLVLAEVLMRSGMSGPDLVCAVRSSYPSTAVMLMTGFTDLVLDAAVPLLRKPFTSAALVARVAEGLAQSRHLSAALQETFERNLCLKQELALLRTTIRENLRRSRRQRAERSCYPVREPDAAVPTVLIAEDDPGFRYAVCHFLSSRGLSVLPARDGTTALDLACNHPGPIDVLVTDLGLGSLDGMELAKAVIHRHPGIRVIFMTADCCDLPYPTLRKPFDLEHLLSTLIRVLSSD